MQLILSGVFRIDVPPGNVPLAAVQSSQQHPMVAQLIPISLDDNFRGFRIVGTSPDYLSHYQASFMQGQVWTQPMQVVLRANWAWRWATPSSVHTVWAWGPRTWRQHVHRGWYSGARRQCA